MNFAINEITKNKNFIWMIKAAAGLLIIITVFSCFLGDGIDSYYSYKDYNYQNDFTNSVFCNGATEVIQTVQAKGNILSNVSLYFGDGADTELALELIDEKSNVIYSTVINTAEYDSQAWNSIAVDCHKLVRGQMYSLRIAGSDLSRIALNSANSYPEIFGRCLLNGEEVPYILVMGIQSTYTYVMLGSALEFLVKLLFIIIIAIGIFYTIINFEKIFEIFRNSEKKQGLLYAIYFAVYLVLLFNPMDSVRTEVTEFKRVIGAGIVSGVDVSKRINNFSFWFLYLAVLFILFYLLANYFKSKEYSEENRKVIKFLDNIIVLANVVQGFRCISFFYDESQESTVFYYSEYLLMAVLLLGITYIVLSLEKKISTDGFIALIVSGMIFSYPLTILISNSAIFGSPEWASGKLLMGVQIFVAVGLTIIVKAAKINWNEKHVSTGLIAIALCLSFIPFCTSFFIELITILNQRKVFISEPGNLYFCAIIFGLAFTVLFSVIISKKRIRLGNWKNISYPVIVFGLACLWQQIEISAEYGADLIESANSSILISDFLNFGDIPIVEHYGGHMMTGVWEGIIYGVLNNDYFGAIFSPYSGYVATVIAVLFFCLMRHICEDENLAFLGTLFFPFYNSVGYWALGILVCLAVLGYIKKNSYKRAMLVWLAVVWCVLYRLDLGFAFAFACVITLVLYVIFEKNVIAAKQLMLSLFIVGILGVSTWFILCLWNGINPFLRLLEFLLISASNQNWAYSYIGDSTTLGYVWVYIFVPFVFVICLVYTILSKKFRDNIGKKYWALLFIFGFSYIFNFSRGLVRHSMAENALVPIMWTVYIFLALFIARTKNNSKMFIPVFAAFIICNNIFLVEPIFKECSIADYSVERVGDFTETWRMDRFSEDELAHGEQGKTYWKKIKEEHEVIKRVKPLQELENVITEYQIMMDAILEDDETFVDFINKTFIYSTINRQNPVYVSQSPLQISGEFTQEEFIKEIEDVPIVLMPVDEENYLLSVALDNIANPVRYYKIAEYIYQNYVPLCRYEEKFAVWCLPERYDEMASKIEKLSTRGIEIKDAIVSSENIAVGNAKVVSNADGSININSTGIDPMVCELQNLFDVTPYIGSNLKVAIEYETDVNDTMQMFYTTEVGEGYNGQKVQSVTINGRGTAYFTIPVTQYTRIRLDTPEESKVKITSFKMDAYDCKLINCGYDGPFLTADGITYNYLPYLHFYNVGELPRIWAEEDEKKSRENMEITDLKCEDEIYIFDNSDSIPSTEGNYLNVSITYPGKDAEENYKDDDEATSAELSIGKYVNGKFETKYTYKFDVKEGQHEYMFRISSDYYWYLKQINAAVLLCEDNLLEISMEILEGD